MNSQTLYKGWILEANDESILAIAPNGDVVDLVAADPLTQGKQYVDRFNKLDEVFNFLESCQLTHEQETKLFDLLGQLAFQPYAAVAQS